MVQKTLAKEYGKLSKSLEVPFKSGEFAADGLAAIWQGMRNKNSELAQLYTEESHLIKTGVLANLNRLKGDIKKHLHDLNKEGIQGSKKVDKRMGKFVNPVSRNKGAHFVRAMWLKLWANGFLLPKPTLLRSKRITTLMSFQG